MNSIQLQIDGVDFKGWFSCQITRTIEAISGGFSLGLTTKWEEKQKSFPIACGMSAKILIDNETVINGYIDTVEQSFDSKSHNLTVSGRDKSADLVDCSAVHSPSQFMGLNALELAKKISSPFGVNVDADVDLGTAFSTFKLDTGEKVLDALLRALKQRELLAVPDRQGGILLTTIGRYSMNTSLIQGQNILSARLAIDTKERYSHYICHGQQQGNDEIYGKNCSVKSEITDNEIERYRPIIIRSSQQGNADFMRKRACWENTVNKAKSVTLSIKVQGFYAENGQLWDIGKTVHVCIPSMGIQEDFLISSTIFSKSFSEGSITELSLKDVDAYSPKPEETTETNSSTSEGKMSLFVQQSQRAKEENARIQEKI